MVLQVATLCHDCHLDWGDLSTLAEIQYSNNIGNGRVVLRKAFFKWWKAIGSLHLGDDGNAAVGKIGLVEIMSPAILQGSKVSKPSINSLMSSSSSSSHLLPMLSADSIIPCDRGQITSVALVTQHSLSFLDVQQAFQSKSVNLEIGMTSTREWTIMEPHNLTSVDACPKLISYTRSVEFV
jgi:hypothetical protein